MLSEIKIRNKILILIIIIIILSQPVSAQSNPEKINTIEFDYIELVENNIYTVKDFYNKNLNSPLNYTNGELNQFQKTKLKFQINDIFSFGYIKETEKNYTLNEDTLRFYTNILNDEKHLDNYKISFQSFSQTTEGIFLNTEIYKKNDLQLTLISKYLSGKKIIQRNYEGKAYKQNNELIIKAFNDGINSDINRTIEDEDFQSKGYSFGINASYELNKNTNINFSTKNLFSNIYWYNVYTNISKINTDNIIINEEGYKEYISSVTGNSYFDDYKTRLTPEYNFNANNKSYNIGIFYRNKLYPYFNCKVNSNPEIRVGFWSEYLTLKVKNNIFNLEIRTNNFLPSKITSIYLKLGINYSF